MQLNFPIFLDTWLEARELCRGHGRRSDSTPTIWHAALCMTEFVLLLKILLNVLVIMVSQGR